MTPHNNSQFGSPRVQEDLISHVTVGTSLLGFNAGMDVSLDERLAIWRQYNVKRGLTGALLVSGDGIALILEGPASAVMKVRKKIDANPLHGRIQLLFTGLCEKRRFGGWPLAYVGPSRWVQNTLATRPLAEMTAESGSDADFLIELILFLVGEGP